MGNALKAQGETAKLERRRQKLELKHCQLELIDIRVVQGNLDLSVPKP